MADMLKGAVGTAGDAAKGYAAGEGGKALSGAVTNQAKGMMNQQMPAGVDVGDMAGGDLAGTATKAATSAVKGIAGDSAKRLMDAGGSVMQAGEQAVEQGMKMMENVLDTAELAELTKEMGDFAEKHPKLAVLGVPLKVLGVPGLLLFSFLTVLVFVLSLVLALVLALVVALLFLVVFVLLTLLVIFPLFFIILFVGIFGALFGLIFYFMIIRKVKKKYGHLMPDKESFDLPNAPSNEPGKPPVFKKGTKNKLPAKKAAPPHGPQPVSKQGPRPVNSKHGQASKDFPKVPQHEPGSTATTTGSEPKPFRRGTKRLPKKTPRAREPPLAAK